MSVVRLYPELKDHIWGGTRLRAQFGKQTDLDKVSESWELACRSDGNCRTENGSTLWEHILNKGRQILGTDCENCKDFPILIKLIDAEDDLSVQVHPDDEYAAAHAGQGKTEMWYVIDCKPDSSIVIGFKENTDKQHFEQAIKNNTVMQIVNKVKVSRGDVFFVPPGTLHAIGKGVLVAEIQQNSNTTYRVYDYGRLGKDGKPRELHIQNALDVTKTVPWAPAPRYEAVKCGGYEYTVLVRCEFFTAVKFDVADSVSICIDQRSFAHLLMLDGSARIQDHNANKGESFFIDAASGTIRIDGRCSFILTRCGCEERTDTLVKE